MCPWQHMIMFHNITVNSDCDSRKQISSDASHPGVRYGVTSLHRDQSLPIRSQERQQRYCNVGPIHGHRETYTIPPSSETPAGQQQGRLLTLKHNTCSCLLAYGMRNFANLTSRQRCHRSLSQLSNQQASVSTECNGLEAWTKSYLSQKLAIAPPRD